MSPDFFYSTERVLGCFFRIGALLATPSTVDETLQKILDEAVETMGFHQGIICLLDEDRKNLITKVVKNYNPEEAKIAFSRKLNLMKHDCLVTRVARTGNYIVLEDSGTDPIITPTDRKLKNLYREEERSSFYSAFCGPLMIKDSVIGIIAVWYQRKITFPPEVISTLMTFANYISVVIQNLWLFGDNRQKIQRLLALQEAVSQLNSSYDLDKIHEIVTTNAIAIGGADKALLYFLDMEKNTCLISTGDNVFLDRNNIYAPKIKHSIIQKALEQETIIVQGPNRENTNTKPIFEDFPSEIAIPLRIKHKFKGILYLGKKQGDYSRDQKSLLDILIINTAASYDNAIMHYKLSLEAKSLKTEVEKLKERENQLLGFQNIIGNSGKMLDIFNMIKDVARHDTSVLIKGESGTGKELIARSVHRHSMRKSKPFVEVNCAAIPGTLLESELFGYEAGAFTDARKRKIGLLEHASGGTFLLDEIGEMNLSMQAKFLRMLEENHIRRLGGIDNIPIDVRFIFSTNRDLSHMVSEGSFREDLFYRISVVPIVIPPLRDRIEDIMPLVYHYIGEFNTKLNKSVKGVTAEAEKLFKKYQWPGNVRELKNIIERIMILQSVSKLITPDNIPAELKASQSHGLAMRPSELSFLNGPFPSDYKSAVDELTSKIKNEILGKALEINNGNKAAAARQLGISRYSLIRELKKLKSSKS